MEIVFLGSGGGRINLVKQIRATGGFRINSDLANIHIDPGPGALIHSITHRQNVLDLDCIIITHNHTDHFSDGPVLIEAMTHQTSKKRGVIIGSKNSLIGDEMTDRCIPRYHQNLVSQIIIAKPYETNKIITERGGFTISFYPMKHGEPTAIGFKIEIEDKIIGHITDTEYIDSLCEDFKGCDVLVVNCIKPQKDKYDGHLISSDVIKILKATNPKKCIITHLGMKMIQNGAEKEAIKISNESGVETIAANDGMKIEL